MGTDERDKLILMGIVAARHFDLGTDDLRIVYLPALMDPVAIIRDWPGGRPSTSEQVHVGQYRLRTPDDQVVEFWIGYSRACHTLVVCENA